MKRFVPLLAILSSIATLLSPVPALADEDLVEVVAISTTSAVNTTDLSPGLEYALQCSTGAYYRTCATSSCTAVSTDYQLPIVPAGTTVILRDGRTRIAFLAFTGTGTCAIYSSAPRSTPVYR